MEKIYNIDRLEKKKKTQATRVRLVCSRKNFKVDQRMKRSRRGEQRRRADRSSQNARILPLLEYLWGPGTRRIFIDLLCRVRRCLRTRSPQEIEIFIHKTGRSSIYKAWITGQAVARSSILYYPQPFTVLIVCSTTLCYSSSVTIVWSPSSPSREKC